VQPIIVPVVVFTGIVVLLSLFVLAAHALLVPSGDVTIAVNGRTELRVEPGNKLLWTLAGRGILLPAVCGGRGTCGQCRVTVLRGGGPLLPTETAHIDRWEAAAGIRLACMVTVREDLEITVPADLLEAKRWRTTVRSNTNVAPLLTELVLSMPEAERLAFEAGDYVLLEAPAYSVAFRDFDVDADYREDWQRHRLFRLSSSSPEPVARAYSLANAPREDSIAKLLVRIATPPPHAPPGTPPGRVSSYIFSLRPGDHVTISGPFGEFHASDSDREMLMLAGGVGIAPIRSIIVDQLERGASRKIGLWYGARDMRDLCFADEFDALAARHANFEWHAALSEPRAGKAHAGHTGFVHAVVLEQYLGKHPAPEEVEYYLCGPPLMSAAVQDMLYDLGVDRENIFFDDFGR
jgi:Na+-transporting NADH:ubiquinone oxidoreductase subunit F